MTQPPLSLCAVASASLFLFAGLAAPALAGDGDLDPTFSTDGKSFVDWGEDSSSATAVAGHPDGRIVVGGQLPGDEQGLLGYDANGTLDLAFGLFGRRQFSFVAGGAAGGESLQDVTVDGVGRLWATGYIRNELGGGGLPALARFDGGTLDTGYSSDGRHVFGTLPWVDGEAFPQVVLARSNGRLVIAGDCRECAGAGSEGVFAMQVFDTVALVDASFGDEGFLAFDASALGLVGDLEVREMVLDAQGRLIGGGTVRDDVEDRGRAVVFRITALGALDATFGTGGLVAIELPGEFDDEVARGVAVDSLGRVVVGLTGTTSLSPGFHLRGFVARLTAGGVLDTGFAGTGVAAFPSNEEGTTITSVRVQGDGRVVAGGGIDPNGTDDSRDYFFARFTAGGVLDATFDGNGVKRVPLDRAGHGFDVLSDMILSGGRAVAVGRADGEEAPFQTFAVVRLQSALIFADGLEGASTGAWPTP